MAATQINDGSNTTGLTTVDSNGFTSNGSILGAASYASISAVSVGSSIGGADEGSSIWGTIAGKNDNTAEVTNHFWYIMMDSSTAFAAGNGYVMKLTITQSWLRDYITFYKRVSGVDTALTPDDSAFADTTAKRVYLKRGKVAVGDAIGIVQADNEFHIYQHDASEKNFLPLARYFDTTKTTAGFCGLGLGTDSTGKWDDVWSGSVPVRWVHPGTGTNGSYPTRGTKAAPWATWRYGLANMTAGGVLFIRGATYSQSVRDGQDGFQKGTNDYNYTICASYNNETALNNNTGGSPTLNVGGGAAYNLANARLLFWGLKFDGQDSHPQPGVTVSSGASKIRFMQCESYQHGDGTTPAVGFQDSQNGDEIEANQLTDYDTWYIDCIGRDSANTHGFYFVRRGIRTERCQAYDNGENGIQYQPLPNYNENPPDPNDGQVRGQNNIIRFCNVYNNGIKPGAGGTAGIYIAYQDGLRCYGNWVHNNKYWGIRLSSFHDIDDGSTSCLIYNNVAYKNLYCGIDTETDKASVHALPTNNKIRNNISVGNGTLSPAPPGLPAPTNTIRLSPHMQSGSGNAVSHSVLTDPGFVDPDNATLANCDFRLSADTSNAYDAGFDTAFAFSVDWDGFPVPQGNQVDIGAHEFPVAGASPIDPPLDPSIEAPNQITVTKDTAKVLSMIAFLDDNDPDIGTYSVEIVVSAGTLNDGV